MWWRSGEAGKTVDAMESFTSYFMGKTKEPEGKVIISSCFLLFIYLFIFSFSVASRCVDFGKLIGVGDGMNCWCVAQCSARVPPRVLVLRISAIV